MAARKVRVGGSIGKGTAMERVELRLKSVSFRNISILESEWSG